MDGRIRFAILGLCLLTCTTLAQAVEPKAPAPVRVASLAFLEPDGTRTPVVEVWSNGRVQALELSGSRQNPKHATHTDRLTADEMKELHQLLAGDCQMASLTTEGIRESLEVASEQQQLTADIEGAAQTEVGLLVGKHWHSVTCPAVSILSTRFPDVTEVQNIAIAQARLQNIAAVALLGGSAIADLQAEAATRKLRELHPEAGEITRRDLKMVRQLANGNRFVQFHYTGSPGQSEGCLVSLTQSPQGPTRVSVLDSPSVVR
jgi:hypothetical protein